MKTLFIGNNPLYGAELVFNALRIAHALSEHDATNEIIFFLMADAVLAAKVNQKTPVWGYACHRQSSRHAASPKPIGQGS